MALKAGQNTQKAPAKKAAGMRYAHVYVDEHDKHIEQWVQDRSRQLTGYYEDCGHYEGKKYFVREESDKPKMFIYYSEYHSEWYIGETLGGTSTAWVDVNPTVNVPQEKGWLMRGLWQGDLNGIHVDTPLRVKMEPVKPESVKLESARHMGDQKLLVGMVVSVTESEQKLEKEVRAVGMSFPSGPSGRLWPSKLGMSGAITEVDYEDLTVYLGSDVGWCPIKALAGYGDWLPMAPDQQIFESEYGGSQVMYVAKYSEVHEGCLEASCRCIRSFAIACGAGFLALACCCVGGCCAGIAFLGKCCSGAQDANQETPPAATESAAKELPEVRETLAKELSKDLPTVTRTSPKDSPEVTELAAKELPEVARPATTAPREVAQEPPQAAKPTTKTPPILTTTPPKVPPKSVEVAETPTKIVAKDLPEVNEPAGIDTRLLAGPVALKSAVSVFIIDGEIHEKWANYASSLLVGDYIEAGMYDDKHYFERSEGDKPRMLIYWSQYYSQWYIGERLGGMSKASVDGDPTMKMPPERGWRMPFFGGSFTTPLRVGTKSVTMPKAQKADCSCAPCFSGITACVTKCCAGSKKPTTRGISGFAETATNDLQKPTEPAVTSYRANYQKTMAEVLSGVPEMPKGRSTPPLACCGGFALLGQCCMGTGKASSVKPRDLPGFTVPAATHAKSSTPPLACCAGLASLGQCCMGTGKFSTVKPRDLPGFTVTGKQDVPRVKVSKEKLPGFTVTHTRDLPGFTVTGKKDVQHHVGHCDHCSCAPLTHFCHFCSGAGKARKEKLPGFTVTHTKELPGFTVTGAKADVTDVKAAIKKKGSPQWIYVYLARDEKIDKGVEKTSRLLVGDYKESGEYEGKKYFVRKDRGKPVMLVYWSGYNRQWYFGETLGGSSAAWVDADSSKELPADKGWLMRGSVAGIHLNTPLRIKSESVIMHEVHVCEHCICAPCRCIAACATACCTSVASCCAGVTIAASQGSTYRVKQLEPRPKLKSCMEGLLTEMSCSVPISWAFEHTVDAWYRAFFVDGFCHQASYQTSITGAEREAHYARLRLMYGGYTSRFAQEMACNEPIAQAIGDWLHMSSSHASERAKWARDHPFSASLLEEMGCAIPLHSALEHAIDHTHKVSNAKMETNRKKGGAGAVLQNGCLAGLLACLFCHHPKKQAVKSRSIEVKPGETAAGAASPEVKAVMDPTEAERELEKQYWLEVEARKKYRNEQLEQIEYEKQQVAGFQKEIEFYQPHLDLHKKRHEEMYTEMAPYKQKVLERQSTAKRSLEESNITGKLQTLKSSLSQVAEDNRSLKVQKEEQQKKKAAYELPQRSVSTTWNKDAALEAKHTRIQALEAQLLKEREDNDSTMANTAQAKAKFRVRLQEMELSNAELARQRQELSQELARLREQQQTTDQRVEEMDKQYMSEIATKQQAYSSQIETLRTQNFNASSFHKQEKQDFENRMFVLGQEKGHLKQQYEIDLRNMQQAHMDLEAQRNQLLAKIQATQEQDAGQLRSRQYALEAELQAAEMQMQTAVQQLQMANSAEEARVAALEQKLRELEQVTQQEYAQLVQGQSGSQGLDRQLDEYRIVIEDLRIDTTRKDEKIRSTERVLEEQRSSQEAELSSLQQQLAMQSQPSSEEQMRANEEIQEISYIIETEREQSNARMAELENALLVAREEIALLEDQLQNAGIASPAKISQPSSQQSLSPGQQILSPGMQSLSPGSQPGSPGQTKYMMTRPPEGRPAY